MLKIKKLNEDDLRVLIFSEFDEDGFPCSQNSMFDGFHYFTPNSSLDNQREKVFITAFEDDEIVGIIKCAKFNSYTDPNSYDLGVCYVDVKESFRKKGLASKLIKSFFYLTEQENTNISYESDLGKLCHIHNIFKKYSDGRIINYGT